MAKAFSFPGLVVGQALELGAELAGVGVTEIIEDNQRVAPGGAAGGVVAGSLVVVAGVGEDLGFDEAAAGLPDQVKRGSVAVAGLLVVAGLLMCAADGVPCRGLTVLIAEFAELAKGLFTVAKSLLVIAQLTVIPAHAGQRGSHSTLVAGFPVEGEALVAVAKRFRRASLLVKEVRGDAVRVGLHGAEAEPSTQVQ